MVRKGRLLPSGGANLAKIACLQVNAHNAR